MDYLLFFILKWNTLGATIYYFGHYSTEIRKNKMGTLQGENLNLVWKGNLPPPLYRCLLS